MQVMYLNGIEKNIDNTMNAIAMEMSNNQDLTMMETDLLESAISSLGSARALLKTAKLSIKGNFEERSK